MKWQPEDIIVGILALVVALFIIGAILNTMVMGQTMTEDRAKIISGVVTSAIAVISVYIGSKLK